MLKLTIIHNVNNQLSLTVAEWARSKFTQQQQNWYKTVSLFS